MKRGYALLLSILAFGLITESALAEWTLLPTGVTDAIYSLYFLDDQVGYATGWVSPDPLPVTLKTTDGGQTWSEARHSLGDFYFGTTFTDYSNGYVAGYHDGGSLLHTNDGGASWTHQSFPNGGLYVIDFVTDDIAYTCGYQGSIYKTTDGADTWSPMQTGTGDLVFRLMDFVDETNGFAVAGEGFSNPHWFYRTTDGEQWELVQEFQGCVFGGIHFFDPDTGLVVGYNGRNVILITYDGGESWEERYSSNSGGTLQWVNFNGYRGWTVSPSGTVLRSLDRGETWEVDGQVQPGGTLLMAVFDTGNAVYAAGERGRIYRQEIDYSYWVSLTTESPSQSIISPNDGEQIFSLNLHNIGEEADTYHVNLLGDFPAGWNHTIEADGVPAGETSIEVSLGVWEASSLIVRVNPQGNPGKVELTVDLTSQSSASIHESESFRLIAGPSILLVDDDDGDEFEVWFENSLEATVPDRIVARWDISLDELNPDFLETVDLVIWFTGNSQGDGHTLTQADQALLQDYLNNGGALFLTGQGIGFDIRQDDFWSDYLHAHYNIPLPASYAISGVTEDPVSNGLVFSINGGTGADNQSRQHAVSPLDDNAVACFAYNNTEWNAALRITTAAYRALYLGFGFEAIADEQSRNALMGNAIDWLLQTTAIDRMLPETIPEKYALYQNYPNPFNPSTNIVFDLVEDQRVSLIVYNTVGQTVATLANGSMEAGRHAVNFDATALSSGLYFYRLETDDFSAVKKMILMK